jgi:2-keto-4-pentenoate hydratase/2-oxohepta-3-ene-1,7-dioic acid hydratase in catechol pathway
MKLASFIKPGTDYVRSGLVLDTDKTIVDMNAGYALFLDQEKNEPRYQEMADALMPTNMVKIFPDWPKPKERLKELNDFAQNREGELRQKHILFDIEKVDLMSPIPRPPAFGIGYFNTRGIIEEASRQKERAKGEKIGIEMALDYPKIATISWSHPRCVIGPSQPIVYPEISNAVFDSIELCLIVGKEAYRVPKEKAGEYIAGYTVTSDITVFDRVQDENFVYTVCRSKSMPTFWPCGPWMVFPEDIGNVLEKNAFVRINGEQKMKGNFSSYIYSPEDYIADVSKFMILEPGTMIAMGCFTDTTFTFLTPGDIVENEIESIGVMKNRVVSEKEAREKGIKI